MKRASHALISLALLLPMIAGAATTAKQELAQALGSSPDLDRGARPFHECAAMSFRGCHLLYHGQPHVEAGTTGFVRLIFERTLVRSYEGAAHREAQSRARRFG